MPLTFVSDDHKNKACTKRGSLSLFQFQLARTDSKAGTRLYHRILFDFTMSVFQCRDIFLTQLLALFLRRCCIIDFFNPTYALDYETLFSKIPSITMG